MPKTEIVYARLQFDSFRDEVKLDETRAEINERLFEVLTDDYYLKSLTQQLIKQYSENLEPWIKYRKRISTDRPDPKIQAVGRFEVTGQAVTLTTIRFY